MMRVLCLLFILTLSTNTFSAENKVIQCLKEAALDSKVNYDILYKIAYIESSLNPKAKNPRSSARGLFQIINSTEKYIRTRYNITGDIYDACTNSKIGAYLVRENITYLINSGYSDITNLDLYLAHFLGAPKAIKLDEFDTNSKICKILPIECRYNKFMKNMTIEEFRKYFQEKLNNIKVG